MEAVNAFVGILLSAQLAQVALLTGVFFRLGSMKATQEAHHRRLDVIESKL